MSAGLDVGVRCGIRPGIVSGADHGGYFPITAVAMKAAVGYGTWSAGWLCEEGSGSLQPAFGSPALAPSGSPLYAAAGPFGDRAVTLAANPAQTAFLGGDVFDVGATDDLCVVWVGRTNTSSAGTQVLINKGSGGSASWRIAMSNLGASLGIAFGDGVNFPGTTDGSPPLGAWYVGMAVLDRGSTKMRIGYQLLDGTQSISGLGTIGALGSCNNASNFGIGDPSSSSNSSIAAAWIGVGVGAAAGMANNMAAALANITAYLQTGRNAIDTVDRDPTSLIYCPSTAAQWQTILGLSDITSGGPTLLHLCQDPSGTLVDALGVASLGVSSGTLGYQQAQAGWTRLAATTTDTTGAGGWVSVSASLPDGASESALSLTYAKIATPPATRSIVAMHTTELTKLREVLAAGAKLSGQSNGNTANGTVDNTGVIRPYVLRHNFTASTVLIASDQEKIAPVFVANAGKRFILGGANTACGTVAYLYNAFFKGAAAELTDAKRKTLLQTLGWTIPWS